MVPTVLISLYVCVCVPDLDTLFPLKRDIVTLNKSVNNYLLRYTYQLLYFFKSKFFKSSHVLNIFRTTSVVFYYSAL